MVNPETFLITNEYVRHALGQLVQVAAREHINPLQFLQIVESHMLTADFTFFQQPRQFALNDLLISVIQAQYEHQRRLHDLTPVKLGMSLASAVEIVKEDATTANQDLIGWAWLYFHYVEVSLHVSQQKFCEMVSLDDRTIRRYQNHAIDQLAKHIIRLEQKARADRRKQLLYLQLPHQGGISNLVEREQELEILLNSKFKHFHIVGGFGVGKTVFTELVLQEKINNNELDQIVWFQSPENAENIKSYLKERLLIENTKITLSEYISIKRVAIVIEDSENLQKDLISLQNFLQEFSNANVFLMSHVFYPIPSCFQLNLRELTLSATKELLRISHPDNNTHIETIDYAQLIWQSIGGNPLAIKLLAQNWSIFDIQSATLLTLDQVFSKVYNSLIPSERLAWLILAMLKNTSSTFSSLSKIKSPDVHIDDFVMLSRLCIATTDIDSPSITLTISACRYIQYCYETRGELQSALDTFIAYISLRKHDISEIALAIIESALSTDWILIHPKYLFEAARRFWKKGILRGHYTKWNSILSKYSAEPTSDNLDLILGYGICQRYLGQWSQAYVIFTSIVQYAGLHGYFLYQAEALLELAVLHKYQGNYEDATDTLNHLSVLPPASLNTCIQNRLLIERVELALENNNLSDAHTLLTHLPENEPRKIILQIETYAKEPTFAHDIESIALLGDRLFHSFDYSSSIIARIHVLMGRIWEKGLDIESAIKHLSIALSLLLDQDNDPFALARTQSNLAGLLIHVNQLTEARTLLKSAEYIQRQIGDRVGLAVTMHNEHVVDRKIVN